MKTCHFFVSYNPLFNNNSAAKSQAHEFYELLQKRKELYWGKLKVAEFSEPFNFHQYQKILAENKSRGEETFLYVSDYKSLWIGVIEEVAQKVSMNQTLPFYKGKKVEIWFKIKKFDLVSSTPAMTGDFLDALYVDNEYFPEKLSGLGQEQNGLRFPMIIQDKKNYANYPKLNPDECLQNAPELPSSYVICESNFQKLSPVLRETIMKAENLLVDVSANKDRKKLVKAISLYLSGLELLINETLIAHLRAEEGYRIFVAQEGAPRFLRSSSDNSKTIPKCLSDVSDIFDLGQIKMIISSPIFFQNISMERTFKNRPGFWDFCRQDLRNTLKNEGLLDLKNAIDSGVSISESDRELLLIRNILLGVGGDGVYNRIIESFHKGIKEIKKVA